ncbi:MAG: hexokinase [Treponema sp.]|nr:hexokinase [Treponema sp.]
MNKAVAGFLSRHNFPIHADVNAIALSILDDMNRGLNGQKSDEDMIPTFSLPPEKNAAGKSVIVIDAGGTNFRSCLVTFDSEGKASISHMEKTKMPGVEKELSKKEFFDQFAKNLAHLKDKSDSIGFCFSYPMTITEDGDGVLINFSKEVKAPEVVGCAIGKELKAALASHGWKEINRITLLNDTVAALLAGKACAKDNPYSSFIGFILGTGMNAAYIQPAFGKSFEKQIVVCESGKTKAVVMSDFDKAYDAKSQKPGTAFIEKQCAGGYLGPVGLEMIRMACEDGLFSEKVRKALSGLETLSNIEINEFLHAPYDVNGNLSKLCASNNATEEDYECLFQLFDALEERSARSAAAILVACVIQSGEGKSCVKPVSILCNGSTFWKTHMIFQRVNSYLEECLTIQRGLYWKIVSVEDDITLGTAIGGLIER